MGLCRLDSLLLGLVVLRDSYIVPFLLEPAFLRILEDVSYCLTLAFFSSALPATSIVVPSARIFSSAMINPPFP